MTPETHTHTLLFLELSPYGGQLKTKSLVFYTTLTFHKMAQVLIFHFKWKIMASYVKLELNELIWIAKNYNFFTLLLNEKLITLYFT